MAIISCEHEVMYRVAQNLPFLPAKAQLEDISCTLPIDKQSMRCPGMQQPVTEYEVSWKGIERVKRFAYVCQEIYSSPPILQPNIDHPTIEKIRQHFLVTYVSYFSLRWQLC